MLQESFGFIPPAEIQLGFSGPDWDKKNGINLLTQKSLSAITPLSTRGNDMTDIYRGFEVASNGAVFQIFERGKLIDDAASETAAYDRIDKILADRRAEDSAENLRNFR